MFGAADNPTRTIHRRCGATAVFRAAVCLPAILSATVLSATRLSAQSDLGKIDVVATATARPCQWQIKSFAERVRRNLHVNAGIPFPSATRLDPLQLQLGFGKKHGPYVGESVVARTSTGKLRGVVKIRDPFEAHPDDMRCAIASAIIKAEIYSRAKAGAKPVDPPDWFVGAIAAQTDQILRASCYEEAHSYWAHGAFPRIDALLEADSLASRNRAIAAQIVAWVIDQTPRRGRWDKLFDYLAAGKPWTSDAFLFCLFGDVGANGHDATFDSWFASRGSHIFRAGTTTMGTLSRFRLSLVVFPWEYGGSITGDVIENLDDFLKRDCGDAERALLRRKAARFKASALGRDPEFQNLCALYAEAAESGAEGKRGDALEIWKKAEALRISLEGRTAMGEILSSTEKEPANRSGE